MNEIVELVKKTKTKSVLYVEDDKYIRQNITALLSTLFKRVSTTVDGVDGLKSYKKDTYDYVITDIKMPKMNGIAMMEEILKINPDQLLVVTTAHGEKDFLKKYKGLGINFILRKPITFDSLFDTLKKMVF